MLGLKLIHVNKRGHRYENSLWICNVIEILLGIRCLQGESSIGTLVNLGTSYINIIFVKFLIFSYQKVLNDLTRQQWIRAVNIKVAAHCCMICWHWTLAVIQPLTVNTAPILYTTLETFSMSLQKIYFRKLHHNKLDMSTARRRLKSPQSLYGTSTHPTMVTHRSQSWSWMIDSQPFLSMSISASTPIHQIRLFQTLTFKLQGQGQGHGCGQRARPYSQPSI